MYFQKKTVNLSKLDVILFDLKLYRKSYQLYLLGKVKGRGYNDDYLDSIREYQMRRLDFNNQVLLEQFIQTKDQDIDDYIISKSFSAEEIPEKWTYHLMK